MTKVDDVAGIVPDVQVDLSSVDPVKHVTINDSTWLETYTKEETNRINLKYHENINEIANNIDDVYFQIKALVDANGTHEDAEVNVNDLFE